MVLIPSSSTFHYWIICLLQNAIYRSAKKQNWLGGQLTKTFISPCHNHGFSPLEQYSRSPKHLHSYPPGVLKHLSVEETCKSCSASIMIYYFVPGARVRVTGVRPQVAFVDVDASVAEPEGGILVAGEPGLAFTVMPRQIAYVMLKYFINYVFLIICSIDGLQ